MKLRLPMLLATILLFSSCGLLAPYFSLLEDWSYSFNDGGLSFASLQGICTWTTMNVAYDTDLDQWGYSEYWASPEQTFASRKGDCEDKTLLFMYFAYTTRLAADPLLVAVLKTPTLGHALVKVDNMYYDPTFGTWGPWSDLTDPVMYTLNYGEAMYVATHNHDAMRSIGKGIPLDSPWYNRGQSQTRSHDVGAAASPTTLRYHAPPRRAPSEWPADLVHQWRGAPGR
jgi:hypothetical protein